MGLNQKINQLYDTYKSMDLERRRSEYNHVSKKYPDRVPILLRAELDDTMFETDQTSLMDVKIKYVVPSDLTFAHLMQTLRTRLPNLRKETGLFLCINGSLPVMTHMLSQGLQDKDRDDDGFFTVTLITENTFGHSIN